MEPSDQPAAWEYCELLVLAGDPPKAECQVVFCGLNDASPRSLGGAVDATRAIERFRTTLGMLGRAGWEMVRVEPSYSVDLGGTVKFPSSVSLGGMHQPSLIGASAWLKRRARTGRAIDDGVE